MLPFQKNISIKARNKQDSLDEVKHGGVSLRGYDLIVFDTFSDIWSWLAKFCQRLVFEPPNMALFKIVYARKDSWMGWAQNKENKEIFANVFKSCHI